MSMRPRRRSPAWALQLRGSPDAAGHPVAQRLTLAVPVHVIAYPHTISLSSRPPCPTTTRPGVRLHTRRRSRQPPPRVERRGPEVRPHHYPSCPLPTYHSHAALPHQPNCVRGGDDTGGRRDRGGDTGETRRAQAGGETAGETRREGGEAGEMMGGI
jgi:hypothetical protein